MRLVVSEKGYFYKIYKNGKKKRISKSTFIKSNKKKGGNNWVLQKEGNKFKSYNIDSFSGHCTIHFDDNNNIKDVHCKQGGNKKCGTFNGIWICNHGPSRRAYENFRSQLNI